MRKIYTALIGLAFIFTIFYFKPVVAQDVNNFEINSFTTDYYLQKSDKKVASMKVVEKIVATFPEYNQNHGILRAIPEKYENDLSLKILSVTNEKGDIYNYSTSSNNSNTILKIGNANQFVHGRTTYVISYEVKNFINFNSPHDEFYWDVNGDQWAQPVGKVSAIIHVPTSAGIIKPDLKKCFSGRYGVKESSCHIKTVNDKNGQTVTVTAKDLNPYETLTFVMGFAKGTFEPDKMAALLKTIIFLTIVLSAFLPILITFASIAYLFRLLVSFVCIPVTNCIGNRFEIKKCQVDFYFSLLFFYQKRHALPLKMLCMRIHASFQKDNFLSNVCAFHHGLMMGFQFAVF